MLFFLPGLISAYFLWTAGLHTKSPIVKHCPKFKIGNRIQILPRLKIFYKKDKAFICHHWLYALPLLLFLLAFSDGLIFAKGFLLGSVGHGLTYQDRFQLRENQEIKA
ncbi:MAG: hypothetical protein Q7S03_04235 [bacterium]|nr:hypothetical protein [bacterium]